MALRVPMTDEKAMLRAALDSHRDVVVWKVQGVADDDLRRPMVPSGTSMLGLVKHLASVEYGWFVETFGREAEPLPFADDDPDADLRVEPRETTESVLAYYARARAAADAVITELSLDDTARVPWREEVEVSMRWVLLHMVEETCRHAGHLDILREMIDGATGDHPRTP